MAQPPSTVTVSAEQAWPAWPEYALLDDLLPSIRAFAADGPVALATLVSVENASPRPLGSEMVIAADGRIAGYVSGGCVEAAVAAEALAVLAEGRPRLLDYGVGSPVIDIQLTCGGRIGVFTRELFAATRYVDALAMARRGRFAVTVFTDRSDGAWRLENGFHAATEREYARVHEPPIRLVVVGADPATLALARLAVHAGVEVTLLRPHGPATLPPGLTLARYDNRSLSVALDNLALDPWTAVYTLSHDADVDHAVMMRALQSPAFAVGALGSRHKIPARLTRLRSAGIHDDDLRRLNMPAGLAIGAQTPQTIALSILAEVSQAARGMPP
ncbi:XdhC family protein [Luteibacter pinisoli]|uniref:XdhC family protein n=1 Tax=Luteibacter pinisoli TaxID=2589080 RepID=A0A4Y5Z3G7_9GAMM|nr:XdhC family protein [Luteibacter pinisoli]QDE39446.1 XdhC family protein [Luteibacter pinisoli]